MQEKHSIGFDDLLKKFQKKNKGKVRPKMDILYPAFINADDNSNPDKRKLEFDVCLTRNQTMTHLEEYAKTGRRSFLLRNLTETLYVNRDDPLEGEMCLVYFTINTSEDGSSYRNFCVHDYATAESAEALLDDIKRGIFHRFDEDGSDAEEDVDEDYDSDEDEEDEDEDMFEDEEDDSIFDDEDDEDE